jgi:hypothetical protein
MFFHSRLRATAVPLAPFLAVRNYATILLKMSEQTTHGQIHEEDDDVKFFLVKFPLVLTVP